MKHTLTLLTFLLLAPLAALHAAEFYVAPSGNDADPGTKATAAWCQEPLLTAGRVWLESPKMGRPLRTAAGGVVYHVLNRANARIQIFEKPKDYEALERTLAGKAPR